MEYYIFVIQLNTSNQDTLLDVLIFFLVPPGKKAMEEQISKQMFICMLDKFLRNGPALPGNG